LFRFVDSHSVEGDIQLKEDPTYSSRSKKQQSLRMDVIWQRLSRVERRREKMDEERWRRDEARQLAVKVVYSNSVSSQSFSGIKPSQPPNPTHDGGFSAPQCHLARRTSIGQPTPAQR
jgi:hypothetical protein